MHAPCRLEALLFGVNGLLLLLLLCLHMHAHSHTHTHMAGCPAGGRFPHVECFLALCFALPPVSYSLQSRQRPQPNPRTLDEYTPRQNWSAIYTNTLA